MDENNETLEVVSEETGEVRSVRRESLASDIRNVLLQKRRMQRESTTWSNLSQAEQQTEIDDMTDLAFDIIGKVIDEVASAGSATVTAMLKKFAVADGKTTITCEGRATNDALIKLNEFNMKKQRVILSVVDEDQFNEVDERPQASPDQPDLVDDIVDKDEPSALDNLLDGDAEASAQEDLAPAFDAEADIEGDEATETQAYMNGQDAVVAEIDRSENPYPAESMAARLWEQGYNSPPPASGQQVPSKPEGDEHADEEG